METEELMERVTWGEAPRLHVNPSFSGWNMPEEYTLEAYFIAMLCAILSIVLFF